MSHTCQTCEFHDINVGDDGEPFMECHRYPPVLLFDGDAPARCFPTVDGDDWCGEYVEHPPTVIEDGFGSNWVRCAPDCSLEVVRPGKAQCNADAAGCPNADALEHP